MTTDNKTIETKSRKVVLSTLWVFALVNYLYCDIVSLMDPELLRQYMTGNIGGIHGPEHLLEFLGRQFEADVLAQFGTSRRPTNRPRRAVGDVRRARPCAARGRPGPNGAGRACLSGETGMSHEYLQLIVAGLAVALIVLVLAR